MRKSVRIAALVYAVMFLGIGEGFADEESMPDSIVYEDMDIGGGKTVRLPVYPFEPRSEEYEPRDSDYNDSDTRVVIRTDKNTRIFPEFF